MFIQKSIFIKKLSLILGLILIVFLGLSLIDRGPQKVSSPEVRVVVENDVIEIAKWCREVGSSMAQLKWPIDPCQNIYWQIGGHSVEGRPLVFADSGDILSENTTLVFATVHGDEVTPLYVAVQLARSIQKQNHLKARVVIAPLVNPDGYLHQPRTRMNARGVDVNRNFKTVDWNARALQAWKTRFKSDRRRYPGRFANSEPETLFQTEMIRRFRPTKILSIHSPLNFLDYDGPTYPSAAPFAAGKFPREYTQVCEELKKSLNAISGGFFPGSLGNYAGKELGIPTLTLELPSADHTKAETYWKKFHEGIQTMIQFSVPHYASGDLSDQSGS